MEGLLHFFSYSASFAEASEEAVRLITRVSPTNIPWGPYVSVNHVDSAACFPLRFLYPVPDVWRRKT